MSTPSDHATPLDDRPDRTASDGRARHDLTAPRLRRLQSWNVALTALHAAQVWTIT